MRLLGTDPWKDVSSETMNRMVAVLIVGLKPDKLEVVPDFCGDPITRMELTKLMLQSKWKPIRGKGKAVGFAKGPRKCVANAESAGRNVVAAALEAMLISPQEGIEWESDRDSSSGRCEASKGRSAE